MSANAAKKLHKHACVVRGDHNICLAYGRLENSLIAYGQTKHVACGHEYVVEAHGFFADVFAHAHRHIN